MYGLVAKTQIKSTQVGMNMEGVSGVDDIG